MMARMLVLDRFSTIEPELTRNRFAWRLLCLVDVWIARQRTRRALGRLDRHRLDDIAVTADRAAAESARPFWEGDDALRLAMERDG